MWVLIIVELHGIGMEHGYLHTYIRVCVCVCGACVPRLNMPIPAENIAAALAFSSLVRSLEEKVKTLTADNESLERELTNTHVDLRAAKTELTQHQEESQQALESLTKKCLAFEEELSKLLSKP